MVKMDENEKIMEIKFDSSKEKIFIFFKKYLPLNKIAKYLEMYHTMEKSKIFILFSEDVDCVKVIKDIKEEKQ